MEIKNTKDNLKMAKRMAMVLSSMIMEINTKVNLKMKKRIVKVFTTLLTAANKRECIRMGSKWAASSYDLWKNNY